MKKKHDYDDRRADARQNRNFLIIKARDLFALKGPDISLSYIAREAGVSRTTFYRNFSDKTSLIMAIFNNNLDQLEEFALKYGNDKNSFKKLLRATTDMQIRFQSLIPYLPVDDKTLTNRLSNVFEEPVKRAIEAGEIRSDFSSREDLPLIISMLGSSMLYAPADEKPDRIERAVRLLMEGLGVRD